MQAYVYTILHFSENSLPRAHLLPDLIVLTPPRELSADHIPIILEVTRKLQNQGLWQMLKSIYDSTY